MIPTTFLPHPVHVEAVQVTVANLEEVADWCKGSVHGTLLPEGQRIIEVHNAHGEELTASVGDWIVSHPTLGISNLRYADEIREVQRSYGLSSPIGAGNACL